jgi:hypothetical protein
MKKLIVHIGTPKAGSSTIQRFLKNNQELLAAKRGAWIADRNLETKLNSGFPIAYFEELMQRIAPPERKAHLGGAWEDLAHKMDQAQKQILIVSAETLAINASYSEFFETAREHFKIQVIGYFRRQDEWIVSAWKQWPMKNGVSLEEFASGCIAAKSPRFLETFESWKRLADDGDIYIRPLLPQFLHPQGLSRDFAEAAGIHHESLDYNIPVVNSTFDYKILSILQTKPSVFKDVHDNGIFNYLEKFSSFTKAVENTNYLSHSLQNRVSEAYLEENRQIHRNFFPELDFSAVFPPPSATEENPLSMIQALSEATAIQFKMLQTLDAEVTRLNRQVLESGKLNTMQKIWRRWVRSFRKRSFR